MRTWRELYGRLPTSYDWSRTHARQRGGEPLERLTQGEWPAASVVTNLLGTWTVAHAAAMHLAAALPAKRRAAT
jgi:hypothetical protein